MWQQQFNFRGDTSLDVAIGIDRRRNGREIVFVAMSRNRRPGIPVIASQAVPREPDGVAQVLDANEKEGRSGKFLGETGRLAGTSARTTTSSWPAWRRPCTICPLNRPSPSSKDRHSLALHRPRSVALLSTSPRLSRAALAIRRSSSAP